MGCATELAIRGGDKESAVYSQILNAHFKRTRHLAKICTMADTRSAIFFGTRACHAMCPVQCAPTL